jgi:hypothetical protein
MIELYHNNLSVCAQKVRIVLAEKEVPWTSRYVSLVRGEQLTPEFKKMNPRGLVLARTVERLSEQYRMGSCSSRLWRVRPRNDLRKKDQK